MLDLQNLPPRMRRSQASEYLERRWGIKRTPATLAKFASIGGGPEFQKFNSIPLYEPRALDEWVEHSLSKSVKSTAELVSLAS